MKLYPHETAGLLDCERENLEAAIAIAEGREVGCTSLARQIIGILLKRSDLRIQSRARRRRAGLTVSTQIEVIARYDHKADRRRLAVVQRNDDGVICVAWCNSLIGPIVASDLDQDCVGWRRWPLAGSEELRELQAVDAGPGGRNG